MPVILVIVLLLTAALTALRAHGQEPPPRLPAVRVDTTRESDDRTVSEERAREEIQRVPGSVDVIGQQQISESRASNLKDVLDFTPGVLIRPRLGGAADESQFSIRGSGLRNNFHLRGVNVLIDGFPFGNADGFADFEAFELLDTKRIELYKGGNALRYGANTLGGALDLVTKTGYDAGLFEIRSEAGSFGFLKNHLATGQVYGPLDFYTGLSDTEIDGYRDHSQQARRRLYSTLGYRLGGGTTLRFDFNDVKSEEELPGPSRWRSSARTRVSGIRSPRPSTRPATRTTRAARSPCGRRSARARPWSGRRSSTTRTSTIPLPSR